MLPPCFADLKLVKGTLHPKIKNYLFRLWAAGLFIHLDSFGVRCLPSLQYNGMKWYLPGKNTFEKFKTTFSFCDPRSFGKTAVPR